MATLSELSLLVDSHWQCNATNYPPLSRLTDPDDIRRFKLRHALSHLHKQLGKLEAAHEEAEHGEPKSLNDHEQITALIGKSLIGVLHYAILSDCSVEEIEGWIEKWAVSMPLDLP
jgi:hypothetical protein